MIITNKIQIDLIFNDYITFYLLKYKNPNNNTNAL